MNLSPPAHWLHQAGPCNWFRASFPPTWQMEVVEGTLRLAAPETGGLLTISSFWPDESQAVSLEQFVDLDRLFPRRRKVRPLKPIESGDRAESAAEGEQRLPATAAEAEFLAFEGESPAPREGRWWQRLLHRRQWYRWRAWCVRRGPVYVLALYVQNGQRSDREAETMAGMIVNSLEFREPAPCPPAVFARRVLELARRKFPLLDCEQAADFQIKLGDSRLNLFNFYRSYVNAPESFEALVLPALTTVVQVQGWGPEQTEPGIDLVRERIMPMLYPEEVWRNQFPNVVGVPWVAGLVVLFVVDESRAYWYIRDDLLATWQLSADELHELAVANLERYFDEHPMELTVAGEEDNPLLMIPTRVDSYNTSRLLSRSFREKIQQVLGGEFVVGAPGRDFFVAVNLQSPEALEKVRQQVADDFEQTGHPLSDRLLLVTHDGVAEYAPWTAQP